MLQLARHSWAVCIVVAIAAISPSVHAGTTRSLTFDERVEYQRRIERIRFEHRLENVRGPHRSFEEILSDESIRAKVESYLSQGQALARQANRPLSSVELQTEMERMARSTKSPSRLQELFAALDDDPYVIAECLARPLLTERLIHEWYDREAKGSAEPKDAGFDRWWTAVRVEVALDQVDPVPGEVRAAAITGTDCAQDAWIPLDPPIPSARSGHTAVWTGSEMIVWGGDYGGKTGGRYDPATDTWQHLSTANVPSSRKYHTAVWTGTEMIVWGGASDFDLDTGGRYDPANDTWTATSTGGDAPSARHFHTAVWTGTEMIVWGGHNFLAFLDLDTGGRYDPSTDTWLATGVGAGLPHARLGHAAVWTGTKMIVWGGGWDFNDRTPGIYTDTGGVYDPATDTWSPTSTVHPPAARYGHTAIWTGTEMIVWGGNCCGDPQGTPPATYFNTGGRYDPATNSWTPTETLTPGVPVKRSGHSAIWTGTKMIVWGGYGGLASPTKLNSGGSYDPVAHTWSATGTGASVPSARTDHTAVWTGTEMIVWGGSAASGKTDTGGRYDPTTNGWVATNATSSFPDAHSGHTAVWTGAEMIVWGGGGGGNTGGRYDPATDSWSETSTGTNVPTPRGAHTAIWTGTEMIVWGGIGSSDENSGGRYSPATDTWVPTSTGANVPAPRRSHVAVWTGTEMIVWGGFYFDGTFDTVLGSGGRYDPSTDSWAATATGGAAPTARAYQTAVWTGSTMIVWGGKGQGSNAYLDTGGRYDPATNSWTATATGGAAPTARAYQTAVWTGTEMIVWGGKALGTGNYPSLGGRYDPVTDTWSAPSTVSAPASRASHTAIWTGTQMIVWGGAQGFDSLDTGGLYDPDTDTWVLTGTTDAPSARVDHGAVWTGTEMVVWGGSDESGLTNNGGRYCPCTAASAWYDDADGDGYGDPGSMQRMCSTPAGWIAAGGDCDDASAAVHPDAVEVCNAIDDDCNVAIDDAPAPAATTGLAGSKTDTIATFDWSPVAGATGYDVVQGSLLVLLGSAGDFSSATIGCSGDGITGPFSDDTVPAEGEGLWYLVRAQNCGGPGSYDAPDPGQVAPSDAGIGATCP